MKRYRIGKTLEIRWPILTNKEPLPLEGRDLKLVVKLGHLYQKELSFDPDGNVAIFSFPGSDQSFLGVYQLTLWENFGKGRQTVVDCCDAFELVATTNDEGVEMGDNLEINVLELGSGNLETGLPGPAGPGVPAGGQPGQVLTKAGDEDFQTVWSVAAPGRSVESSLPQFGTADIFNNALAEDGNVKPGAQSHAEGNETFSKGRYAHSEGSRTRAEGMMSHAEGEACRAIGISSHAENSQSRATGDFSHAEGAGTISSGVCSHAEGRNTQSSGRMSHAEGNETISSGECSHAGGNNTKAAGANSFSHGYHVVATGDNQTVCGAYNSPNADDAFQVGIGNETASKNGFAVGKDGRIRILTAPGAMEDMELHVALNSKIGYLQLSATLGAEIDNWPLVLTSSLAEVQAAFGLFWANPGRYRWSLTINSTAEMNPFVEEAELEPLHRDDGGLELLFTSKKSGLRYAIVLTREEYEITAVSVEYRPKSEWNAYLAAGASFDPRTGYFTVGQIDDISLHEIETIYRLYDGRKRVNLQEQFANSGIKTNFPIRTQWAAVNMDRAFQNCLKLSEVAISTFPGSMMYTFYNCPKLERIIGVLDLWFTASAATANAFDGCSMLRTLNISRLRNNIGLKDSPLLSIQSLQYLTSHAVNSAAITVTVHPDVYARLIDPTETEWYALNEQAAAKNIAFATV